MSRLTRRQAVRLLAVTSAVGAIAACSISQPAPAGTPLPATSPQASPSAAATAAPAFRRAPLGGGPTVSLTPLADFYDVAITQRTDWLTAESYALMVGGAVQRSFSLKLSDVQAFPPVEQMRTLECIGNPAGGNLIGNAMWKGARLADVLGQAGLHSTAIEIRVTGADGYATSVPVSVATDADALLVYEMDGGPLPEAHGGPLRVLFPGRYGQKQPKWLVSIEAITEPFLGHWERQGWSNEAIVKVNSQIRTPKDGDVISVDSYPISGTVFSPQRGVAQLVVSADGGQTWQEARLVHAPTPLAWSEWRYDWLTPPSGDRTLIARATDNEGNQQPLAAPSGSSQLLLSPDSALDGTWTVHRVQVSVKK